jgi:hypothetical protein
LIPLVCLPLPCPDGRRGPRSTGTLAHPGTARRGLRPRRGQPDKIATLACENGNCREVFRKMLAYTDFPLDEVQLYFTGNTILLPSEY